MKYSIAVCTLCAALAATSCQAWAPSAGFGPRTTTTSIDHRRRNQFQIRRTPTAIYSTLEEDEQKERSEAEVPSSNADSISEAFNRDEAFSPMPYSELTIGIVKETFKGENRVSQTPDSVRGLVNAGFTVIVQSGGKEKMTEFESCSECSNDIRSSINVKLKKIDTCFFNHSLFSNCIHFYQPGTMHPSAILYTPRPVPLSCRMSIKYFKTQILSPRFVLQTTARYLGFAGRPCSA